MVNPRSKVHRPRAPLTSKVLPGFLIALLAFNLVAPVAYSAGGGVISNILPTVETFTHSLGANVNDGDTDVFSGTVKDRNSEVDIVNIKIHTTSGPVVSVARAITAADIAQVAEPAGFTAGWKVWNPVAVDGEMSFKYQYTYPVGQSAVYVWRFSVQDEGAYQNGPAADITVTAEKRITIAADPVLGDGTADVGARFGAWTVDPGAANTPSNNYIMVTNTGLTNGQSFTLDYTDTNFIGVTDATKTIALDSNIQFAWWEDTTPGVTSPDEGSYVYGASSATGSVTPSFTVVDNIIYIKYRVVAINDPQKDQAYQAAYTVDPV